MKHTVRVRLSRAGSPLLALLFPDDCRLCGVPLKEFSRVPVCGSCLNEPEAFAPEYFCSCCRTPFLNPAPLDDSGVCRLCRMGVSRFDAVYSYGSYDGALKGLIQLFKYDGVRPLAKPLGAWLAQALPRDQKFDALAPMPLHWRRHFRRGFNQAALLAKELSKRTGLPVKSVVTRRKSTEKQALLTRAQRRLNVSGAFKVPDADAVRGKRILLIDDVFTTGATLNACAGALKRAGAAHVSALTLARVDRRPLFDFNREQFNQGRFNRD